MRTRVLLEMREIGRMDFRIIENETGIHLEYLVDAGRGPRYWERARTFEKSESGYRNAVTGAGGCLKETAETLDYIAGDSTLHRPLDNGFDAIKIFQGNAYRLNDRGDCEWAMINPKTQTYLESMWSAIDDWSQVPTEAVEFFIWTEMLGIEDQAQLEEIIDHRRKT